MNITENADTARTVFAIDGRGSGRCHTCKGRLDYSWAVRYSDGSAETVCSVHLPRA